MEFCHLSHVRGAKTQTRVHKCKVYLVLSTQFRVKSGNFRHQVNLDIHLQTVKLDEMAPYEPSHKDFYRICLDSLFYPNNQKT